MYQNSKQTSLRKHYFTFLKLFVFRKEKKRGGGGILPFCKELLHIF